jgi:dolichyl-diphosphooligosaccharide---protein glycosyltransferase
MAKSTPAVSAKATSSATTSATVAAAPSSSPSEELHQDPSSSLFSWAWVGIIGYAMSLIVYNAYRIRMSAIDEFGPVIHEFDPYFNYRATEVRRD